LWTFTNEHLGMSTGISASVSIHRPFQSPVILFAVWQNKGNDEKYTLALGGPLGGPFGGKSDRQNLALCHDG
jgi:hypothetical protein